MTVGTHAVERGYHASAGGGHGAGVQVGEKGLVEGEWAWGKVLGGNEMDGGK